MANKISTYGTAEQFVKSALMGFGATEQDANGRFYLDGNMVNVELSNVIAEAIYIEEIFRDGQSVTGKYTTDRKAGAVRVLLDTPFPFTSRTTEYGGRQGTPGNGGVINVNPPLLPTNDEFIVYLNQVNDQAMLFPDLGKEYIPLDVMAKKIAGYAKSVAQDRSASTLAEIIAYAFFRALNAGDNLVQISNLDADNAYATAVNSLNAKLDNGDPARGAYTYATEGRTIIGRPSFINKVFNRNSGLILTGSDLAQAMLKDYDLDVKMSDKDYVGTGYKGYAMQFHWQSCPDYIWSLAEKYLGLTAGSLDNVYAIAVSFESTAMGRVVDLGVKMIDASEVRGIKAQPLNVWGHEAFRKSYVIGDSTLTTTYLSTTLGYTADTRVYPIAPKAANAEDGVFVPVYGNDGTIIGYKQVASGPKPNGGNFKSGLSQVASVVANTATKNKVALTSATTGADIYYTTDGSEPTLSSTKYSTAITVASTATSASPLVVKAIAVKAGMVPSAVFTGSYVYEA